MPTQSTASAGAGTNGGEQQRGRKLLAEMAEKYGLEPEAFSRAVKSYCFKRSDKHPLPATDEELCAFLIVASRYELDPFLGQIFAFRDKRGDVKNVVSVDGWVKIAHEKITLDGKKALRGFKFVDTFDQQGLIESIRCSVWRADTDVPFEVTEYYRECWWDVETWKRWPIRMLRHKSLIQTLRYAFGISGLMDQDEFERMMASEAGQGTLPMRTIAADAGAQRMADVVGKARETVLVREPIAAGEPEDPLFERLDPEPVIAAPPPAAPTPRTVAAPEPEAAPSPPPPRQGMIQRLSEARGRWPAEFASLVRSVAGSVKSLSFLDDRQLEEVERRMIEIEPARAGS